MKRAFAFRLTLGGVLAGVMSLTGCTPTVSSMPPTSQPPTSQGEGGSHAASASAGGTRGVEIERHGSVRFASGDFVYSGTANRIVEVDGKITKIFPKKMRIVGPITGSNAVIQFSEVVAP